MTFADHRRGSHSVQIGERYQFHQRIFSPHLHASLFRRSSPSLPTSSLPEPKTHPSWDHRNSWMPSPWWSKCLPHPFSPNPHHSHPPRWESASPASPTLATPLTSTTPPISTPNAGSIPPQKTLRLHSTTTPAPPSNRSSWVPVRVWARIWPTMRCGRSSRGYYGGLILRSRRRAGSGSRGRRRMWFGINRR